MTFDEFQNPRNVKIWNIWHFLKARFHFWSKSDLLNCVFEHFWKILLRLHLLFLSRVNFFGSNFDRDYFAKGYFIRNPINTSHNFVLGLLSHVEEDSTHLPSRRHKRQLIVVVNFRYGPTVLIREHHSLEGIPVKSYLNTNKMLVVRHFSPRQMS